MSVYQKSFGASEFDALTQTLPPDDDILSVVSPCRRALQRILWGYALQAITFSFWKLQYLLPLIGMFLQLLGFRTLRRENRALSLGYVITVLRTILCFGILLLNTTIWCNLLSGMIWQNSLTGISLLLQFWQLGSFAVGLKRVQQKAAITPRMNAVVGMLVWLAALSILAWIGYRGILLSVLLIMTYVLLIRSLFHVAGDLERAGYAVTAATLRISDRALVGALVGILLIGAGIGYGFFGQYPMEWQPLESIETDELTSIQAKLLNLGFPEEILADLSEEELSALQDAEQVLVTATEHPVNPGREVEERRGNKIIHTVVYDQKELMITGIGVKLAGERESWRIIHHFRWVIEPDCVGTESIQLWTADRLKEGWRMGSTVSGRLLCDREDGVYWAEYAELGEESYVSRDLLFGEQQTEEVFAVFSLPKKGENARGYLTYTVNEMQDGWIMDAWINYTHQISRLQYPVLTAKAMRMQTAWQDADVFLTIQDALQFNPNDDPPKPFS